MKVDLLFGPKAVPDSLARLILDGEGCTDRSASLYVVAKELNRLGFSKNEILSVLSDRSTYLGKTGYDHGHCDTGNRSTVVRWLERYTVGAAEKAIKEEYVDSTAGLTALTEEEAKAEVEKAFGPLGGGGNSESKKKGIDYDKLLEAFVTSHPYRTISDMEVVYVWTGTHYESISPIEIKGFAEAVLTPKPTERNRNEFYAKIRANHITARRKFFFETTEGKINFKNGVLDLAVSDKEIYPHSPDIGFRTTLPYDYDPKAKCPKFREWVLSAMLGDKDLVAILQEYMGYVVRGGEYKYHKALWLSGAGRNGKSTFLDVLKELIGQANYSVISIKALMGDRFAGSELDGKIANFSEETSPEELQDSGPFKNLTGDGDLSAQKKFGDLFQFRNRAKLIMSYNIIPALKDLSRGMLSRPLIIPFRKDLQEWELDRGTKPKLLAELPGIFNFALEGWYRLEKQEGFTESEHSAMALQRVRDESCNVHQWIDTYLDFPPEGGASYDWKELYLIYKSHERRYAFKPAEFQRRLSGHPVLAERKTRTNARRFYQGVLVRSVQIHPAG